MVGYRTRHFPGFYLSDSGHLLAWSVDAPEEAAAVLAAQDRLGAGAAVVLANPLPPDEQLDPDLHDRALDEGLRRLRDEGISGHAVTPFLLTHLDDATSGASIRVNVRLIHRNAELAGRVAVAWSDRQRAAGQ